MRSRLPTGTVAGRGSRSPEAYADRVHVGLTRTALTAQTRES